jgi:phage tail-like protein
MPLPDPGESVGHSFGLEVDGIAIASFAKVSGLKMEQDVIELKESTADGGYVIRRLPGRWKAGECVLTRGLTGDTSFEKWITDSRSGTTDGVRKNGAVIVFDVEGQEIKRYALINTWPRSLEIETLEAGGTSVIIENLRLVYEGLEVG